MITAPSIGFTRHLLVALVCLSTLAIGQQPSVPTTSEVAGIERFRAFERTYQDGLKRIHLPLLTSYLTQLHQLATASKEPNPTLDQEITRVQKSIAEGGLIDLNQLGLPETQKSDASPTPSATDSPPGAVLVLKAENAKGGTLSKSSPPSLTLGEASWPIDRLSEGNYEVLALYCLPEMAEGASLTVSLDSNEFTHELSKDRTTKPDQFRILRLGRLNVDQDVVSGLFSIKMMPSNPSGFQIRQIIIAKPRSQKPPK